MPHLNCVKSLKYIPTGLVIDYKLEIGGSFG